MTLPLDSNSLQDSQVLVEAEALGEEVVGLGQVASPEVAEYAMRLGDDSLILAQQLSWWISRAPDLEEDLALANISLDLLGHARALLRLAGSASGRSEDDMAYWRDEDQFRNCWLVEQPGADFGAMIARQFFFSSYQVELYRELATSSHADLAAIAAKAFKEVVYHRDHAVQWVLRLAGGTAESRERMRDALESMTPYLDELFEDDELALSLHGEVPLPSFLRAGFDETLASVWDETGVVLPPSKPARCRGRFGVHSTELGLILAEMQWLARRHPGAKW